MSVRIGSNVSSLSARRHLSRSTTSLTHSIERLASGQRINRASDDSAGLAISDSLNAKGRIFNQGIKNLNEGISLLNVGQSALQALNQITSRQI